MIDGDREFGYTLTCDRCGECCDEVFEAFGDAVEYKKDRSNNWHSKKDESGEWEDICPDCWEHMQEGGDTDE